MSGNLLLKKLESLALKSRTSHSFEWEGATLHFFQSLSAIESVLLTQQKEFIRSGGPPRLGALLGNGLLRSQGETHRTQRRLTGRAFSPSQVKVFETIATEIADRHISAWPRQQKFDLHAKLTLLTLETVARCFFSLSEATRIAQLGWCLQSAIENLEKGTNFLSEWKRKLVFTTALSQLEGLLYQWIETNPGENDLLSVLKQAHENNESAMSRVALRDELVTLLVAGHETTASALAWAGVLLAENAQIAETLRAGSGEYAESFFYEVLRLYPPAWVLMRKAQVETQVDGSIVSKNSHVVLCPYTVGRDPEFYPEPLSCLPERWLSGSAQATKAFFPFGLGNRRCLGEAFALMQARVFLQSLVNKGRLRLAEIRPCPEALFTLRPRGGVGVVFE